jgi:hypothetical protein
VPRIPSIYRNSIVYLYRDCLDAETGVEIGGSGFLFTMPSRAALVCATAKHANHIYVVTNAHVIESGCPVVRVNLKYPGDGYERTRVFSFSGDSWVIHPDHDLAVRAMPPDLDTSLLDITLLTSERFITQHAVEEEQIGPGDDLFYIGRFRDHAGKLENLPSVRFGNISMLPNEREPIEYETEQGKKRKQVGFLVEARSRSGYSGSPVFLYYQHQHSRLDTVLMDFQHTYLLGVDWGHIPERVQLMDPGGHLHGSKWYVEVHAGMMGVVPAWYLEEFIQDSPILIEQRRQDDEYYGNHPPTGVPLVR